MSAIGKLTVKVVCGKGLQNKETLGSSDPYCKLEAGGIAHKTKHVSGNLNPEWNEEFEFEINPGMDVIALSIWDKNTIKKDSFMGYSFITFDDCKKDQDTEKTASLLGGCSGEVMLLVKPNYETSASKIERLDNQVKQVSSENAEKNQLKVKISELSGNVTELKENNKKYEDLIKDTEEKRIIAAEESKNLATSNESLKKDLNVSKANNSTLTEKNQSLLDEINHLKTEIELLKSQQSQKEEIISAVDVKLQETKPCGNIYEKLNKENEKLIQLKEDLLEKLLGFQTVQELVFYQLKTSMNEMRSNKSEQARQEFDEQLLGFEKVQELIFNQFNGKMETFNLSLLKEIVMEVKALEQ